MSEKAETCFVLPLREAVAHFARRNTRSTDAKMGGSDNGNAHTSIDIGADFAAGFFPLLGEQGDYFLGKILASSPRRPSADTTNGEKCLRCSRQAPRYFFFFSRS
jgi:hypothetical protein